MLLITSLCFNVALLVFVAKKTRGFVNVSMARREILNTSDFLSPTEILRIERNARKDKETWAFARNSTWQTGCDVLALLNERYYLLKEKHEADAS